MREASQHWTEVLRAMTLEERLATPHAVAVRRAGETDTFLHLLPSTATPFTAEGVAQASEKYDAHVTRWVALGEPEYRTHIPIPGWRQVTYFI